MSPHQDPELFDVLQDAELMELADLLRSARRPEPPLDDAFRSSLRRQLMQKAYEMSEGRPSFWRRLTAPQGLAWSTAAVGVVLIASVVAYAALQPRSDYNQIFIDSPVADKSAVKLSQPILVHFNQPMNHETTEAAVQITPATTVTYTWTENTLSVQPTSGNLAPNTQYQVTIGPSAQTSAGAKLTQPTQFTFVTQPAQPPVPSPSPSIAPTPTSLITPEHQLANLGGAATAPVQWAADSTTVYFVGAKGALDSVPAKGGDVKVLVADGASSPAIAPAGDRLAYIRGGRIEVLTLATGTTAEISPSQPATIVDWARDKLVWATADGIYTEGGAAPTQLVAFVSGTATNVISIAPDGAHAIYERDHTLAVVELATAKSAPLGASGALFDGWSPDATKILYGTADATLVSDLEGATLATLQPGDASWSTLDGVLLGSDTDLYQVRPDGYGRTKLAGGTYRSPQWAPNGSSFVFFRGGVIWSSSAPPPLHEPAAIEQAAGVVDGFMKARLGNQPDQAKSFLDDAGKQAYSGDGLNLLVTGDLRFSRYYVLLQEMTGANPDTAVFVVRLVLTQGKRDVSEFEETLTLTRDSAVRPFLIDHAQRSAHRDLGVGAEVVSVDVTGSSMKVTFDSDLIPGTVSDGVIVLDPKGNRVDATTSYAGRTVTIGGLQITPGSHYKLVVLTTVKDVSGRNIASEYDLSLTGPLPAGSGSLNLPEPPTTPSPQPTPHATPSASSSPLPSSG
jgi:hypothetical protein